jgi:hypothetical protein
VHSHDWKDCGGRGQIPASFVKSSPTNSFVPRRPRAIERFAKSAGYEVVEWFNDPAVSGADPIEVRVGFAALLARIDGKA